jgi:hypothetical protein
VTRSAAWIQNHMSASPEWGLSALVLTKVPEWMQEGKGGHTGLQPEALLLPEVWPLHCIVPRVPLQPAILSPGSRDHGSP